MSNNTRIYLILLLIFVQPLSASLAETASLAVLREAELSMLSVCPESPSIAFVGGAGAAMMATDASNAVGSRVVVERDSLEDVLGEQCFQGSSAVDPNTVVPAGNLVFAMYMVEVNFDPSAPLPTTAEVNVIRVDTGAVIFSESFTVTPENVGNLSQLFSDQLGPVLNAVNTNPYECKNKFTAQIEEQVSLLCSGIVSAIQTSHTVNSNFTLKFVLDDLDFSTRGAPQTVTGTTKILPANAKTKLALSVTHSGGRCTITMTTERNISINLQANSVDSTFQVTIPHDVRQEWSIVPKLVGSQPLFAGPTTMTLKSFASGVGECQGPGGGHTETTSYKHYEPNDIGFGTHKIKPVCNDAYDIPIALTKVPNLGVANAANLTADCATRSAKAKFGFRRSF